MTAKVINIFNSKGGIGKTTFSVNIASILASKEKNNSGETFRVLLIDSDSSSNSSLYLLGAKNYKEKCSSNPKKTIHLYISEWLEGREESFSDDIIIDNRKSRRNKQIFPNISKSKYSYDNLNLIPGHRVINELEKQFYYKEKDFFTNEHASRFKNCFKNIFDKYDYVIIDSSPNFTCISKAMLSISDFVIAPFEPDWQSTVGFITTLNFVKTYSQTIKKDNLKIKLAIPNKMNKPNRKDYDKNQLKFLEKIQKEIPEWRKKHKILKNFELFEEFPENSCFTKILAENLPIIEINDNGSLVVRHKFDRLIGRIIGW